MLLPISASGICCVISSVFLVVVIRTDTASITHWSGLCCFQSLCSAFLGFVCQHFCLNIPCRSSSIRPGQFGYGKVPFSLPLHRTNRQARHTANGTDEALELNDDEENTKNQEETEVDEEDKEAGRTEENGQREISKAPAGEEEPPIVRPHQHVDRPSHTKLRRSRVQSQHPFQRSSSPPVFINRHRFDWNSITAPPPPSLSRQRSSPLFSSPLHQPSSVHRDREPHPDFHPQPAPPAGNIYPLQHPSHPGVESGRHRGGAFQVFRCSGPEKENRRCFSQVRPSKSLHTSLKKDVYQL